MDSSTEKWMVVDKQDPDPPGLLLGDALAQHVPHIACTFASHAVASAVLGPFALRGPRPRSVREERCRTARPRFSGVTLTGKRGADQGYVPASALSW
jgi:hypothetical protein